MRTKSLIIGLVIGALALAGCSAAGGGTGGTLTGVTWALTSYTADGTQTAVPADVIADATFGEDGSLSGSGGCNRFTGSYTQDGAKLTIGPVASTQMFCEGPGSDVESAYLPSLSETSTFTASAEKLTLYDAAGTAILEFAAAQPGELGGVTWHATGINNGKEAVVSVAAGTDPTAIYDAATGTVTGNAGCNTFNGPAVVDGTAVTIGPLMSTKMACADELATTQEFEYLNALQAATTWEVRGTTLELRDDSGALQVMFEAR